MIKLVEKFVPKFSQRIAAGLAIVGRRPNFVMKIPTTTIITELSAHDAPPEGWTTLNILEAIELTRSRLLAHN
jgi:hypothetical protein